MIRKILVVDDDQVLQLTLKKRMAEFDEQFLVVQAVDGFDALRKLEESEFSLVITDLLMPRMDGMSLISHIQKKYPDLSVIIISGMKREDVPSIEQVDGIVAYFEKPIVVNKLLELVLSTLEEETKGGLMHNVSPVMFMQLMEMEETTCTIRMLDTASDEGGILYLRDGQLLNARVGTLKGAEAVARVFFWNEVTVFLRHECTVTENVINSKMQPIIMAALAAKDENASMPETEEPGMANDAGLPAEETGCSTLENMRMLLEGELGEQSGIDAIYQAEKMSNVTNRLDELGAHSGFGELKVGHIETEKGAHTFLIPGVPPILLKMASHAPVEKILNILNKEG